MIAPSAPLSLEKGPTEQFKRLAAETESCVRGVGFRNARTGEWRPFRCGTCAECVKEWSARIRRGFYRAARDLGLTSMLTLTLPADLHRPGTLQEAIRSRRAVQESWNRFRTFLRKRGFMGETVAVPEAHGDGTCHLHVAFNDLSLVAAFGGHRADSMRKAQAFLQAAWTHAGGGFLWWGASKGSHPWAAAGELAKYVGKAIGARGKAAPPWAEARWCTVEDGFRKRPWHRFWASRAAAAIIRGPEPLRDPEDAWETVAVVHETGRFVGWSPGRSVAICPECDGHLPDPSLPFLCHHARPVDSSLACWCVPPWCFEPPWSPPKLALRLEATEPVAAAYDRVDLDESFFEPARGIDGRASWVRAGLRTFLSDRRRSVPMDEPLAVPEIVMVPVGGSSLRARCECRLCIAVSAGTCRGCPICAGR